MQQSYNLDFILASVFAIFFARKLQSLDFLLAFEAQRRERTEEIGEGNEGIAYLTLIKRLTCRWRYIAAGDSVGDTRDSLEELQLKVEELVGSGGGCVGDDLLRHSIPVIGSNWNYAIRLGPSRRNLIPPYGRRLLLYRKKEDSLGRISQHVVEEDNEAVDGALLIDDILDKGMDLAVGERIEADDEGMRAVSEW